MSSLGRWCFRNRRRVVLAWAAALLVVGVASQVQGATFRNDFRGHGRQPGVGRHDVADAVAGGDVGEERLHRGPHARVVDAGLGPERHGQGVAGELGEALLQQIDGSLGLGVRDPDRTIAIAQVRLEDFGPEADPDLVRGIIEDATLLSERADLQVDVGGPTWREAAGVVVALGVLVVTFGCRSPSPSAGWAWGWAWSCCSPG
ncbi:hypothetical protein [Actinomarinicola tropica]|uniref:Membrane transport protein MMPL domain-containing protein n=1 Tax=Actinomarinicola tropica TaxID=2789776 RepID=A0A5Q2RI45_9ACTN|nr:hypothetical protein [Actinomarinicola tropica]QGG94026.1 hypothetical protein GH723_02290 [Actinomarinicola tropica]